ncbi:MAG: PadR family transcriptional regulator [Cumulibacter sp.]
MASLAAATETTSLTLIEGAVLGVLLDRPMHGFELARAFARNGVIGEILTAKRPVVYRALSTLEAKHLLTPKRAEASTRGPARETVGVNAAGRHALYAWLETPVAHMRDVRVELLIKLVLRERLGLDAQPFIARQIDEFTPIYEALNSASLPRDRVQRFSTLWRRQNSHSVMRFLDMIHADASAGVTRRNESPHSGKDPHV